MGEEAGRRDGAGMAADAPLLPKPWWETSSSRWTAGRSPTRPASRRSSPAWRPGRRSRSRWSGGRRRVTFKTTLITTGNGETTPILGIYPRDYINYDLPLEITISTEDLSGPSAGLMLTLGIINIMRGGGLAGD